MSDPVVELLLRMEQYSKVIGEGELLVVQAQPEWTPRQIHELSELVRNTGVPFQFLLMPGRSVEAVRRPDLTAADYFGFQRDCSHVLRLLPVVNVRFDYECARCGGRITVQWTRDLDSNNLDAILCLAYRVLGRMEMTPVPQTEEDPGDAATDQAAAQRESQARDGRPDEAGRSHPGGDR